MNLRLALISATAFLFLLGLGVLFPTLPYFVRHLGLSEFEAGMFMGSYALAAVITAPLWGRFSERYGRRPAILIGLLGLSLAFGLFGLGSSFAELLGARILGGLLAGALQPSILAYTADITAPDRRSVALGVVGASFGLGAIAGPVLGGLLNEFYGPRAPFFATAAIGLAAAVAAAVLLPESLTNEIRAANVERRRALASRGVTLRHLAAGLSPFLAYSFLVQAGRTGFESTIGFLVDDRFGGQSIQVGYLLGAVGVVAVLVQGGGLRALARRYSDHSILMAGTAGMVVGLIGVAFAGGWGLMIAASLLFGLGIALLTPTFTAELSRVAEDVQGEAQGLNASAQSLARAFGPLIFTSIYVPPGNAAPYLLGATFGTAALVLAYRKLGPSR